MKLAVGLAVGVAECWEDAAEDDEEVAVSCADSSSFRTAAITSWRLDIPLPLVAMEC